MKVPIHLSAGALPTVFDPVFACVIAFASTTRVILPHKKNVPSKTGSQVPLFHPPLGGMLPTQRLQHWCP
jgi:hypothetical protein